MIVFQEANEDVPFGTAPPVILNDTIIKVPLVLKAPNARVALRPHGAHRFPKPSCPVKEGECSIGERL